MDFARKQLEKYGWKDGAGLGKECQGIALAIKPILKTGKAGMGYDLCTELTDTWWTRAYADSLSRINVSVNDNAEGDGDDEIVVSIQDNERDGDDYVPKKKKSKKSKNKEKEKVPLPVVDVEVRPMEKMRRKMMKANFTAFSKGGTLTNGEMEELPPTNEESDVEATPPPFKMLSDEDLLKACGGRTAHKAARFGLKLNGKLARIAAQEQNLPIDISSSNSNSNSNNNSNDEDEVSIQKKKKKKRKKSEVI